MIENKLKWIKVNISDVRLCICSMESIQLSLSQNMSDIDIIHGYTWVTSVNLGFAY